MTDGRKTEVSPKTLPRQLQTFTKQNPGKKKIQNYLFSATLQAPPQEGRLELSSHTCVVHTETACRHRVWAQSSSSVTWLTCAVHWSLAFSLLWSLVHTACPRVPGCSSHRAPLLGRGTHECARLVSNSLRSANVLKVAAVL